MKTFTPDDLHDLLAEHPGPCVSLYAPVRQDGPRQTSGLWKNLLGDAEQLLAARGLSRAAAELLAPASRLLGDVSVWHPGAGGLAWFSAPGFDRCYHFGSGRARAVVGDHFFIKPLLTELVGETFFVLALSRDAARLIRVTPAGCERVEPAGPPLSLDSALAAHDTDEPLTYHTVGRGPGRWDAVFHGHGVGIDDAKDDLLRYFRVVARAVRPVLGGGHAPLVLASVEYLWPIFRVACDYPHLLAHGVKGNPDRASDRDLAERARPLVGPLGRHRQDQALELYRGLAGTGRTTADPGEAVAAAVQGRVEAVFLSPERDVWGRFDAGAGQAEVHEHEQPGDEELSNLAAVGALRHGHAVHAVGPDEIPGRAALAAVFPLPRVKHHPPA